MTSAINSAVETRNSEGYPSALVVDSKNQVLSQFLPR